MSSPGRLLVVDDEDSIRSVAGRVLRNAGYHVTLAADGEEALAILRASPPFDLFVVDDIMPGMRGTDLAARIRTSYPNARIVYFTAFSPRILEEKGKLDDNESVLEKPATACELLEAVARTLSQP